MVHVFPMRVYFDDTDFAGIVYYANYLRFIERARSEWLRSLGLSQVELHGREGIVFAVRRVEADYLRPARFEDLLEVRTDLRAVTGARIALSQDVWRGEDHLFASIVTLVALTASDTPARLPADLRARLSAT